MMTATESKALKFADLIRRERMARGMNQEEFGRFVGVSKNNVCLWETGKSSVANRRIPQLAKRLKLDPVEISVSVLAATAA